MKKQNYDIVIIGASIGGTLAAISAAKTGKRVVLTEEVKWIFGQFTSQGVPADEHKFIEEFGCTKSYREFRQKIRNYYKNHPMVKEEFKNNDLLNPGSGWVSRISHEPKVTLKLAYDMLLPYLNSGHIELMLETKAKYALTDNDEVNGVVVQKNDEEILLTGKYYLDGTDTGDLLPMTNTEYVTGAESKSEYNERNAPVNGDKEDMQAITWIAALSYHEGENHVIDRPQMYDFYRNYILEYPSKEKENILSWYAPNPRGVSKKVYKMFGGWAKNADGVVVPPMFSYRQIINQNMYKSGFENDTMILNWPQNDYFFDNIFETKNDDYHKFMAKQLTLSLIYWLQTEASNEEGTFGYPGLKLRKDILGTDDGLAMSPYIRESRRIKAKYTIKEQDINATDNETLPHFFDSIGVGCYHIDVHMTTRSKAFFYDGVWPFEIPLGSLIPIRMKNIIPCCKNIGTTHVTNGSYRLHPIEWNIGESAGYLVGFCLDNNISVHQLYEDKELIKKFQKYLVEQGIELSWPTDKVHKI